MIPAYRSKLIAPVFGAYFARALARLSRLWAALRPAGPRPHISDRLARDVGLTPSALEDLRRELPSQSDRHAML